MMGKLIVSMNLTLDGYLSGAGGELDWHLACWTAEMGASLCSQLAAMGTILLGRVTYEAMAVHCRSIINGPACGPEDFMFANMMNSHAKIVFSNTMRQPKWANTRLLKGKVEGAITKLKKRQGGDIMVYGSSKLVTALVAAGLVDEFRLWIHPVVAGKGISFFSERKGMCYLRLLSSEPFGNGVVLMQYRLVDPIRKVQ